jgi:hypothetical protein
MNMTKSSNNALRYLKYTSQSLIKKGKPDYGSSMKDFKTVKEEDLTETHEVDESESERIHRRVAEMLTIGFNITEPYIQVWDS